MARPILRLATRFTRRTRATAWAIAFACMVLVGAMSLADGLANGVGSVANRIGSGPAVYIQGDELLASAIDPAALSNITVDFVAMRAHAAGLEINRLTLSVFVVALESYHDGVGTIAFPAGPRNVSLDVGLRVQIEAESGMAVAASGNVSLFGLHLTDLPIVAPPPTRSELFPDNWAYVRADLLVAMNATQGGPVQAILAAAPLDPAVVASLRLARLETLGAIGFVRGSIAEVQSSLRLLALVIALVIGLLVYAAVSLEVHAPPRGCRPGAHEGGGPTLIGPGASAGLLLCALLLGATGPTLAALPGVPARILAGDAYLVTQGSGAYSINESLAENLTRQPGVQIVSPEILSLGTVRGEPVVVRAAEPGTFLSFEGGEWVQSATVGNRTAYVGEGLVRRLGLVAGEDATVVGSSVPRIAFVHIAGIYRTATTANDEMLVDFPLGRFLSGLGSTAFHSIRLRTSDPAALLSFLRSFGASVHVSGPGLPRADIASDPPTDERISNLILRSGIGGAPRDYLSTAVAQATTSVSVVAYGIAGLLGVLVAFGIHAAQARAFADRAPAVGVLRAIGAGNRWMRRRLLLESFPLALGAAVLGAGLGFLAENWLQPKASLVIFGHAVLVAFDLTTFAFVVLAVVETSMLSDLVLLRGALVTRPIESIRETAAVASPQSLEVILRG